MGELSGTAQSALVAVLAGGAGRRLGGQKAALELGGKPLIAYPLAAARAAGLHVVVLAKRETALPELPCERWIEPAEPRHPLCGIVTALRYARGRPVLAIACDTPFVTAPLLAWLALIPEPATLEVGGRLQPLPGRFLAQDLGALEASLRERVPLRVATERLRPRRVPEAELRRFGDPRALCLNVNGPVDLAAARRLLHSTSVAARAEVVPPALQAEVLPPALQAEVPPARAEVARARPAGAPG